MKIETLPTAVVNNVRARGHTDEQIEAMTVEQLFNEYCNWEGLLSWGSTLLRIVRELDQASELGDEPVIHLGREQTVLYVVAEGQPADDEDEEVPGSYMVTVDSLLSPPDMVTAALDCFHERVPVGNLDPFTFKVMDMAGVQLSEPEKADAYTLGHRASFHGKVIDVECVEANKAKQVQVPSNFGDRGGASWMPGDGAEHLR